ncbi:MAG: hypothetical protein AAB590_01200 [Patescibacteria group bacterium]
MIEQLGEGLCKECWPEFALAEPWLGGVAYDKLAEAMLAGRIWSRTAWMGMENSLTCGWRLKHLQSLAWETRRGVGASWAELLKLVGGGLAPRLLNIKKLI